MSDKSLKDFEELENRTAKFIKQIVKDYTKLKQDTGNLEEIVGLLENKLVVIEAQLYDLKYIKGISESLQIILWKLEKVENMKLMSALQGKLNLGNTQTSDNLKKIQEILKITSEGREVVKNPEICRGRKGKK